MPGMGIETGENAEDSGKSGEQSELFDEQGGIFFQPA